MHAVVVGALGLGDDVVTTLAKHQEGSHGFGRSRDDHHGTLKRVLRWLEEEEYTQSAFLKLYTVFVC